MMATGQSMLLCLTSISILSLDTDGDSDGDDADTDGDTEDEMDVRMGIQILRKQCCFVDRMSGKQE